MNVNRYKYAIRHISVRSALFYGFILGCLLAILPGLFLGIVVHEVIAALIDALSTGFFVPDLGPLSDWYEMGWMLPWRTMFFFTVAGGISSAFSSALGALIYNLIAAISGGLTVTTELLEPVSASGAAALPVSGSSLYAATEPIATPRAPVQQSPTSQTKAAAQPVGIGVQPSGVTVQPPAASTATSGYWLMLRTQPTQRWPVYRALTTLGSATSCDVCLSGLAPHHADIRVDSGRYILYDQSGGKCWVNGRQVTTANMLKDGFVIKLAEMEFIFGVGM